MQSGRSSDEGPAGGTVRKLVSAVNAPPFVSVSADHGGPTRTASYPGGPLMSGQDSGAFSYAAAARGGAFRGRVGAQCCKTGFLCGCSRAV